jgi:hypothetical protein
VERWVLSATPGQQKRKKKLHGAIKDFIVASSNVFPLITRGRYPVGI